MNISQNWRRDTKKIRAKLEENLRHVYGWRDEVVRLEKMM